MNNFFERQRSRVASICASVIFLSTLSGQAKPEKSVEHDDIIVTGTRESDEAARARATNYVRGLGVASGTRAVARWIDPICPKVLGISDALARLVETRIRTNAQLFGVKFARTPCSTNITVSFASHASKVVRKILMKEASTFREVRAENRAGLFDDKTPIRWWYSTEVRGRNGDRVAGVIPPTILIEGGGTLPTGSDGQVLSLYSSSIVSTQTERALLSATIIVDVDQMQGATLNAVADYVSFVGFAEIDNDSVAQKNSILALFDPTTKIEVLTKSDRAFVRELYRLPLDRTARYQRGRLVGAIIESNPDSQLIEPD